MKKTLNIFAKSAILAATALVAMPATLHAAEIEGWGDFKLYLDPGHAGKENGGLWGYSEAEKTLRVALNIKDMLLTYTDMPEENIKLCRYTDTDQISLEERSDEANAWGANFYYSIHSDAGATNNTIVTLFGGWTVNGVNVEKTPNGGKAYGEFLEPNLKSVMRVGSRGNRYDRDFYMPTDGTHDNQYPYLSVNRRSNMPSLLSEGGYHTISFQQARNLNDDYKRLEAFAAFQSILQYRGLNRPDQNFITGVVSNSENEQPINGAKITISVPSDASFEARTYTTDSYESLFHKYTKNQDLIHNGFYVFENMPKGVDLQITFEAEGFETATQTIRVNEGGNTTADYVTFADAALTNIMPAKIDAVSVSDLTAVNNLEPIVLTFSRGMDRASVEQAFSINNDGQVTLSWQNDYTLSIDVNKLDALWDYTIKIDGSIAKNKQTGLLFDGDGDGQPGGDYILNFTMAEPDIEAPYVVGTFPAAEGEAIYTKRPPIRIEFNEAIQWEETANAGWFTVKDSAGKTYEIGHVTYAVIRGAGVLHCYLAEDLAKDVAVLVNLKPVLDLSGNESEPFEFRFLSEYRNCNSTATIVDLNSTTNFWKPAGSGSTKGTTEENNEIGTIGDAPYHGSNSSFAVTYSFDVGAETPYWFIREHNPKASAISFRECAGVITMFVYGDASNNEVGMMVRDSSSNDLLYCPNKHIIGYRGWGQYIWELNPDNLAYFTGGTGTLSRIWYFDSITISHDVDLDNEPDEDDPEYKQWTGMMAFNNLELSFWDDQAERQANIDDVQFSGVAEITVDANAPVEYFNLQGIRVANPESGLYIRRQGNTTSIVMVK